MFWNKHKYNHEELGEFTFSYGTWTSETMTSPSDEILINITGDKHSPNTPSLTQAINIYNNIEKYTNKAKEYIAAIDISEFMKGNGSLVLDGFHSHSEPGQFDIDFGLSNWDDASITIHFKDNKPYEVSLSD